MSGSHPGESMVHRLRRLRVEDARSPMPRSYGYLAGRITRGIRLHDRLVERKGMRARSRSRHEASLGQELDYRGLIGFGRLHGLLHTIQVLHEGLGCLQEIRKRHVGAA